MRDEPEMRNCFQCEVSLNMSQAKKGILLVNDYSHEEFGTAELGRDAGIRPGQPEVNLVPRRSSSHLWFYRGSAEGPAGTDAPRRADLGSSAGTAGPSAIYGFIEALLKAQQYRRLSRGQRGVVRRFLTKVSGLSRAQITRLIAAWMQ